MKASNAGAPAPAYPTETAPGVALSDVVVRAPESGARLVGPASLTLEGGRWTAILGRSGAGKSSLLRAIAGLAAPSDLSGEIRASDGAPLSGRVAWMAQDPLLAPWATARSNAGFGDRMRGRPIDRAAAEAALDAVGLSGKADRLPAALSGGERQRVALARTLYESRPVALLDEPFSALDALTRDEVSALAARRLAGRTVAHVTHDPMEAARLAHRIFILAPSGDRIAAAPLGAASASPPPRSYDSEAAFALAAELRRALAEMEPAR